MSGKMNGLWQDVIMTRFARPWVGLALLALVAGLALLATPTPGLAQEPVDNGNISPFVWDLTGDAGVNGQPRGYAQGDPAAMAVLIKSGTGYYTVDLCLQVFESPFTNAYGFTEFGPWNATLTPLPATLPGGDPVEAPARWDKGHDFLWGYNIRDISTSPSPPDMGAGGACDPNYLGVTVDFTRTAAISNAYLVYGGHLAAPGDSTPATPPDPIVPDDQGASNTAGVFQSRIEGAGDKTINFKPDLIISVPANIIVDKVTDPSGDSTDFDFGLLGPGLSSTFVLSDTTTPYATGNIVPGIYTVTETVPNVGWDLTSIVCSGGNSSPLVNTGTGTATFTLEAGETVTCTYTNTKKGTIIVEKQTDPDGATQSFEFSPSYGSDFSLSDDETNNSGPLTPGVYSVSEINIPAGWSLTSATCDDGSDPSAIGLDPGEMVTCTFTNSRKVPVLKLDKELAPPGVVNGVMTFTISIANVGPTPLAVVPLKDTYVGDVSYVGAAPPANSTTPGVLYWDNLVTSFGGTPLAPGDSLVVKTAFLLLTTSSGNFSVTNTALTGGAKDIYGTPANEDEDTVRLAMSWDRGYRYLRYFPAIVRQ